MAETRLQVYPTKCATCDMLSHAPLACEDCHALYEHVAGADYFELFGLPRSYALDLADLQRRYVGICRNIHPDAVAGQSSEMQLLALRLSATVNRAYDTLRQPLSRAEYLLEGAGGRSSADDKRVPADLLERVMELREQIDTAKSTGDAATLAALRRTVEADAAAAQGRIAALAEQVSAGASGVGDELRRLLNAMKYYHNLLAQL